MGLVYTIGSIGLGAMFLVMASQVQRAIHRAGSDGSARTPSTTPNSSSESSVESISMRLFHGSILYLAALFLLIAVDPFLLLTA